jgi:glycosyltransferase involved in cell wall biosynthesis
LVDFSVVIPTYDRPGCLRSLLEGVGRQTFDGTFEVIVVNDGGPALEEIVEPFRASFALTLVNQENSGPAKARNHGAALAAGRWLVFIDDDCVPQQDWLAETARACRAHPEAGIGGRVVNLLDSNIYASASQLLVDFLYEYYGHDGGRSGRFFTTNNMALPTAMFRQLGGFDENFPKAAGEDREFCDRWSHFGFSLQYDQDVIVGHAHDLALTSFAKQHFRYGSAAKLYWELRRQRVGRGLKMEPGGFYAGLLSYPLKRHGFTVRGIRTTLLFMLAQVANAAGYFLS